MFLRGSITALATPFAGNGVDEPAFRRLVDRQLAGGAAGLVACGTTGEAPSLSASERDRLIRICVEMAGRAVPVIAGTGTNCTATTVEQTRAAMAAGADAALVVTPCHNRPTQEGLYRHFATVARSVELPILLYNVPARTGVDLEVRTVEQLASIPNVIGLKDASGDPGRPAVTAATVGHDFIQLCGDDAAAVPFNRVGGRGCISVVANVVPEQCAALQQACRRHDWAGAAAIQDRLRPLLAAFALEPNPGPVKHALSRCLPGFSRELRLPLVPVGGATAEAIEAALEAIDPAPSAGAAYAVTAACAA